MKSRIMYKRALESRSFLKFDYPGPNNTIEQTFYLPFFENIDISESQKANYAVYDLLSRAGNLYSYMGAKSRSLVIKFSMTLPHIKHFISFEGLDSIFGARKGSSTKGEIISLFLKKDLESPTFNQAEKHRTRFKTLKYQNTPEGILAELTSNPNLPAQLLGGFGGIAALPVAGPNPLDLLDPKPPDYIKKEDQSINLFMFWLNMIRTSVINHSTNSNQGPPIITLNHGIMYNQIPCVCTNYSINIDKQAGYQLETMTPRKVDIIINLEEVRTGNWGEYKRGNNIKGNNLAGWDSFIRYETMDPYGNLL